MQNKSKLDYKNNYKKFYKGKKLQHNGKISQYQRSIYLFRLNKTIMLALTLKKVKKRKIFVKKKNSL